MTWRRVRAVARKEFIHILRDTRSLLLALLLPFVMLLAFGWALSLDVDRIPTVLYDQDNTPESRDLVRQFTGSRYFQVIDVANGYAQIDRDIDTSRALMAIVIPNIYARDLLSGREAPVQLIFDGSDSNTATTALAYAEGLVAAYARKIQQAAQTQRAGGDESRFDAIAAEAASVWLSCHIADALMTSGYEISPLSAANPDTTRIAISENSTSFTEPPRRFLQVSEPVMVWSHSSTPNILNHRAISSTAGWPF